MKWLTRLAMIPHYLALLVAIVMWITVARPLAFFTDCSVSNGTDITLSVTPVGTVGQDGHRTLLPLYRTSFPYFVKSKRGNFKITPNETFHFRYDMDDVNFSEIVIENPAGNARQIVANPNPTKHQYVVPDKTDFTIENFNSLPTVASTVMNAAIGGRKTGPIWMLYCVFAILIVVECLRIRSANRKRAARIAT